MKKKKAADRPHPEQKRELEKIRQRMDAYRKAGKWPAYFDERRRYWKAVGHYDYANSRKGGDR
jgi:hypothetical protein